MPYNLHAIIPVGERDLQIISGSYSDGSPEQYANLLAWEHCEQRTTVHYVSKARSGLAYLLRSCTDDSSYTDKRLDLVISGYMKPGRIDSLIDFASVGEHEIASIIDELGPMPNWNTKDLPKDLIPLSLGRCLAPINVSRIILPTFKDICTYGSNLI